MSLFTKKSLPEKNEIFAALDIGSSKICCAIARLNKNTSQINNLDTSHNLRILGIGHQISRGIKNGHIIDLEALEDSILNAVHSAEQAASQNIRSVYINLPSGRTHSHTIKSEIQLMNNTVDNNHLRRLLNINRDQSIGSDQQIIHVLPISYTLDNVGGIRDPRGMVGEKLSVILHIISAPIGLIRNLASCLGRCHLDIAGFVVSSYASGLSNLVEDELELGVTIIDIGAGNTTMASFFEGNLVHLQNINLGGSNITNDIARGLATPLSQAERLKTLYGTLIPSTADDKENIFVTPLGENHATPAHHVPKGMLTHIIRARVEEILELIAQSINHSQADPLIYQRIVITGGTSQLQGFREMATQILGKQVRLGHPLNILGNEEMAKNPIFSTCAGLLQYGLQDYAGNQTMELNINHNGILKKFNKWLKKNF